MEKYFFSSDVSTAVNYFLVHCTGENVWGGISCFWVQVGGGFQRHLGFFTNIFLIVKLIFKHPEISYCHYSWINGSSESLIVMFLDLVHSSKE